MSHSNYTWTTSLHSHKTIMSSFAANVQKPTPLSNLPTETRSRRHNPFSRLPMSEILQYENSTQIAHVFCKADWVMCAMLAMPGAQSLKVVVGSASLRESVLNRDGFQCTCSCPLIDPSLHRKIWRILPLGNILSWSWQTFDIFTRLWNYFHEKRSLKWWYHIC